MHFIQRYGISVRVVLADLNLNGTFSLRRIETKILVKGTGLLFFKQANWPVCLSANNYRLCSLAGESFLCPIINWV